MTPPVETVRLSQRAKERLLIVRRQSGIEHWNILCRWALCLSLNSSSEPKPYKDSISSSVEITWKTLGNEHSNKISSLVILRYMKSSQECSISEYLYRHLERGLEELISYKPLMLQS